ncbi:hypothetical protein MRX96_006566 [Rhipicephalus microplus]
MRAAAAAEAEGIPIVVGGLHPSSSRSRCPREKPETGSFAAGQWCCAGEVFVQGAWVRPSRHLAGASIAAQVPTGATPTPVYLPFLDVLHQLA